MHAIHIMQMLYILCTCIFLKITCAYRQEPGGSGRQLFAPTLINNYANKGNYKHNIMMMMTAMGILIIIMMMITTMMMFSYRSLSEEFSRFAHKTQ